MDTAAAAWLWNTLTIDIKNALNIVSFKKLSKTHTLIHIIAHLYYYFILFNL